MNERDIYLKAMGIADPAGRAQYLDEACGGDPVLREAVEALLAAQDHKQADSPPISPPEPSLSQSTVVNAGGSASSAESGDGADLATLRDDLDHLDLSFLTSSDRPGALGRLSHYDILEVLGRGAFGTVFKAFDTRLDRMVAVKVLAPELATTGASRQRFIREAKAAASVRHEHIVDIFAVDEQPLPYLVMECIIGQTLQERLDRTGPLPVLDVARIGYQIASGLAAAHALGLIHRDIKPANILLENDVERVKITDFGLARAGDDASLTQSGVVCGTPMYMAPEQALGESLDPRADLFSLGSTLYAMCTGRPPFRARSALAVLKRVVEEQPQPVREVNADVPPWLEALIESLMAKRPDDRISSAAEVAETLGQQLSHLQRSGSTRLTLRTPLPGAGRNRNAAPSLRTILRKWSLALAAAAVVLVAYVLLTGGVQGLMLYRNGKARITVENERNDVVLEVVRDGQVLGRVVGGASLDVVPGPCDLRLRLGEGAVLQRLVLEDYGTFPLFLSYAHTEGNGSPMAYQFRRGHRLTLAVEFSEGDGAAVAAGNAATAGEEPLSRLSGPTGAADVAPSRELAAPLDFVGSQLSVGSGIFALQATPEGSRLVTGHFGGNLCVWDVETRRELRVIEAHEQTVHGLVLTGAGTAISAAEDGTVRMWNLDTGERVRDFVGHQARVDSLLLVNNGETLVSATADYEGVGERSIRTWNVATAVADAPFDGEIGCITRMGRIDEDTIVTVDSQQQSVTLWDYRGRRLLRYAAAPRLSSLAVVPFRSQFLTGYAARVQHDGRWDDIESCVLTLWEADSLAPVQTLRGHRSPVVDIAVSADGTRAVSISGGAHAAEGKFVEGADSTVRVWNLQTGQQIAEAASTDRLLRVAWLPGGRQFVTGGNERLRLWTPSAE